LTGSLGSLRNIWRTATTKVPWN